MTRGIPWLGTVNLRIQFYLLCLSEDCPLPSASLNSCQMDVFTRVGHDAQSTALWYTQFVCSAHKQA